MLNSKFKPGDRVRFVRDSNHVVKPWQGVTGTLERVDDDRFEVIADPGSGAPTPRGVASGQHINDMLEKILPSPEEIEEARSELASILDKLEVNNET